MIVKKAAKRSYFFRINLTAGWPKQEMRLASRQQAANLRIGATTLLEGPPFAFAS